MSSQNIIDVVADLAWTQWSALGAGGWEDRPEAQQPIDPEQLLLFTAWVSASHPRVHAIARAWLHRHGDFISRPRLKNLLSSEDTELAAPVHELLVKQSTPTSTRSKKTRAEVRLSTMIGRSDLSILRIRAAMGVGARAEILRLLAQQPDLRRSTAWLARFSAYSKRNVAETLTMLERANLVSRRRFTNADDWLLIDPPTIRKLLGRLPRSQPQPPLTFSVMRMLWHNAGILERHAGDAAVTEVFAAISSIQNDLEVLDIASFKLPTKEPRSAYDKWAREAAFRLSS